MSESGTATSPLLEVDGLVVSYQLDHGVTLRAVRGVSFEIMEGETLALVGESGCGKSTTAKAVMQLSPIESGDVRLQGVHLNQLPAKALRQRRHAFQMIFQDPMSSLNPRHTIRQSLQNVLKIARRFDARQSPPLIERTLVQVGLDPAIVLDRYPHEFSGGQCQRIAIARALLLDPVLLVCDEPVSALDVSVRAQVLNVLNALQRERRLSMLFISHDLAVVKNVADRVAVMYLGSICEIGPASELLAHPRHPYTQALLRAIPDIDQPFQAPALRQGETPSPLDIGQGCAFRSRCPRARDICASVEPPLKSSSARQAVACHFPIDVPSLSLVRNAA